MERKANLKAAKTVEITAIKSGAVWGGEEARETNRLERGKLWKWRMEWEEGKREEQKEGESMINRRRERQNRGNMNRRESCSTIPTIRKTLSRRILLESQDKAKTNERSNRNEWIHRNSNQRKEERRKTAAKTCNESKRWVERHGSTNAKSACLLTLNLKTSDGKKSTEIHCDTVGRRIDSTLRILREQWTKRNCVVEKTSTNRQKHRKYGVKPVVVWTEKT